MGKEIPDNSEARDWAEYASMRMLHLDSQVLRYGGLLLGQEFSAGRLKFRLAMMVILILAISRCVNIPMCETAGFNFGNSKNTAISIKERF